MNAHCERMNGTIQREFVDFNIELLFADISSFNQKLKNYLLFYNTERVHYAFKNRKTPVEVLGASAYYIERLPMECKNGCAYTSA